MLIYLYGFNSSPGLHNAQVLRRSMQLLRNNCHIRANIFVILVAASGRAMEERDPGDNPWVDRPSKYGHIARRQGRRRTPSGAPRSAC
ncbi:MAG: hypothetical protein EPO19_13135 [Betaproteobacteria bacterium]|nr:MAG: hypothetical protein EPO19_13135 [Betaproteobacteria bacterium]